MLSLDYAGQYEAERDAAPHGGGQDSDDARPLRDGLPFGLRVRVARDAVEQRRDHPVGGARHHDCAEQERHGDVARGEGLPAVRLDFAEPSGASPDASSTLSSSGSASGCQRSSSDLVGGGEYRYRTPDTDQV